jgi:hypothetical protein
LRVSNAFPLADKLSYLRKQAAAYLEDAKSATRRREAERLIMLAARCQEQILELERQIEAGTAKDDPKTP